MKYFTLIGFFAALWMSAAATVAIAAHPYNAAFKPASQVLDNAGVLKPKTLQDLKNYAEDSEYYTGTQIVIGTVASFEGKSPDDYALQAAQALNINSGGKPGVLLIVSKNDRDARIVAGPQLASVLPIPVQQAILDKVIRPNLQQGKIERGIIDGMGAIMMALQGKYAPQKIEMAKKGGIGGWSPMAIIGTLILLRMALGGGSRYGRYGGGSFTGSLIGGVIGALLMGGARRRW